VEEEEGSPAGAAVLGAEGSADAKETVRARTASAAAKVREIDSMLRCDME
jgi:hypothetical protein